MSQIDIIRKQYIDAAVLVFRQFGIVVKCGTVSTDTMSTRPIQYLSSCCCRQMANVGEFEQAKLVPDTEPQQCKQTKTK